MNLTRISLVVLLTVVVLYMGARAFAASDRCSSGGPDGAYLHPAFAGRDQHQPGSISRQVGGAVFLSQGHDLRLHD